MSEESRIERAHIAVANATSMLRQVNVTCIKLVEDESLQWLLKELRRLHSLLEPNLATWVVDACEETGLVPETVVDDIELEIERRLTERVEKQS
jgi:hypothetical protein